MDKSWVETYWSLQFIKPPKFRLVFGQGLADKILAPTEGLNIPTTLDTGVGITFVLHELGKMSETPELKKPVWGALKPWLSEFQKVAE